MITAFSHLLISLSENDEKLNINSNVVAYRVLAQVKDGKVKYAKAFAPLFTKNEELVVFTSDRF